MRGKVQPAAAMIATVTAAMVAAGAGATTGKRSDFDLGFSKRVPGQTAALTLHIVYKGEDPDAKPSPIRKVVIAAPAGTSFHTDAAPVCEASDDELRAQGSGACPAESRVGGGELIAITGFGPPVDPVRGDLTLFNGGDELIEVVTAPGTDRVLGTDRLRVDGSTLTGDPPTTPGGPPDGETAVRQIDLTVDPGFVSTPADCPASGLWVSTGTFGFADGVEETLESSTPCDAAPAPSPPGSARLSLKPARATVGRRTRFTARVLGAGGGCARRATVRIGGRRALTDPRGRVAMVVTVHRAGAHRATAKKRGCPPLTAALAGVR
jgi:hypothetical protein